MPGAGPPTVERSPTRAERRRFLGLGALAVLGLPAVAAACGDDGTRSGPGGTGAGTSGRDGSDHPAPRRVAYGEDPSQFGDLWLPEGEGPHPAVVLVHGGFWRDAYDLSLMDDLAADVAARGWVAWNIEYRRVGQEGGGWPGTFLDVAAAFDHLARLAADPASQIDATRVAVAGHSAGGHLAGWLGTRPGLPQGAPGAAPELKPVAVVSQAGVLDLRAAVAADLGQGATVALLGATPVEEPARYDQASPFERLPSGVPTRCVHGRQDDLVPFDQSARYVAAATAAGDDAVLAPFEGDHFPVLDPTHESWLDTAAWLDPHLHP